MKISVLVDLADPSELPRVLAIVRQLEGSKSAEIISASGQHTNVPLPTMIRALDSLKQQFGSRPFSRKEASIYVRDKFDFRQDVAIRSIGYGVQHGLLFKTARRGFYCFEEARLYEPDNSALVDLICSDVQRIERIFRMLAPVAPRVHLYFSDQGVAARFANSENDCIIDLSIGKNAFYLFRVQGHVRVTIPPGAVAEILHGETGGFHLRIDKRGLCKVGALHNEHNIRIETDVSQEPYGVEQPLPAKPAAGTLSIPISVVRAILKKATLHGDHIEVLVGDNDVTFAIPGCYSTRVSKKDLGVKLTCLSPTKGIYRLNYIRPLLNFVPKLDVKVSDESFIVTLVDDRLFRLRFILAPYESSAIKSVSASHR